MPKGPQGQKRSADVIGKAVRVMHIATGQKAGSRLMETVTLPEDWYAFVHVEGVDPDKHGIYEWKIQGRGSYIGKYTVFRRRRRQYRRNISNLLAGRPYRKGNPDRFRRIHRELKDAHLNGLLITLVLLENVDPADIYRREEELIAERGALNDPPFGRRISN
jgi:hypothetical protein